MPRKIAFRAWHIKNKRMLRVCMESPGCIPEDALSDDVINVCSVFEWKDEVYKVMQYTGLKDSKGVEIYEGDIVKWLDGVFKVKWSITCFVVEDKKGKGYGISSGDFIEIIGNIHENPELLKEKG